MAGRIILGTANPSLDDNGEIAAGSTLTFYDTLTTTLASIYDGSSLATPLANPLTCDASGEFPQVWGPSLAAYSVKWSRPGLADITYDNIFVTSDGGQALNYGAEVNVASAATTDLSTSSSNRQLVLGTTTITSFGTGALLYRMLRFAGSLTLTHNATSLILPTGSNIVTRAGDTALAVSDSVGNWTVIQYEVAGNASTGGTSGYKRFPGGLILQWITMTVGRPGSGVGVPAGLYWDNQTLSWPFAFPNACIGWSPHANTQPSSSYLLAGNGVANTGSGIIYICDTQNTTSFPCKIFAWGY